MKKSFILLSILAAAISFGSCNKIEGIQIGNDTEETLLPQTEVFFQGQKLSYEGQVMSVGTNAKAKVKIMDTAGGLAYAPGIPSSEGSPAGFPGSFRGKSRPTQPGALSC